MDCFWWERKIYYINVYHWRRSRAGHGVRRRCWLPPTCSSISSINGDDDGTMRAGNRNGYASMVMGPRIMLPQRSVFGGAVPVTRRERGTRANPSRPTTGGRRLAGRVRSRARRNYNWRSRPPEPTPLPPSSARQCCRRKRENRLLTAAVATARTTYSLFRGSAHVFGRLVFLLSHLSHESVRLN